MYDFQVGVGVVTGLAFCCFLARMAIRLTYQKQLRLDDAFLILATACLCVGTGILYHITYFLYMHAAALLAPEALGEIFAYFGELLNLQKKVYPLLAMLWTATFSVKACFLVFMHPLVWHISRVVKWYFWFVVGFSIVSWMFVIVDPFIICPYFGADAIQCFASTVDGNKTLALTAVVTVLDILSDLMIVAIPIIILRHSFLRLSTKIGLCIFLGLSIFMAICAIIRIAGFRYRGVEDDTWAFFWQHIEAAVAIMMASITAFRTLFVRQTSDAKNTPESPAGSAFRRVFRRFQLLARAQPDEKQTSSTETDSGSLLKMPKLPSPVFTGIRSFIRKNNRTEVGGPTLATLDSVVDASEADYHAAVWAQTHGSSQKFSSHADSSRLS